MLGNLPALQMLSAVAGNAVVSLLRITFFLLAAHEWTGISVLGTLGGYVGLLTAVFAFYLSAAEVINESFGKEVLPIGAPPAA